MLAARSILKFAAQPAVKSFPAVQITAQPYLCRYFGAYKKDKAPKTPFVYDDSLDMVDIQEIAASIDTTLTPEQKEYVDKIKKKIRGNSILSKRSIHRDVPHPDEIKAVGNYMPRIADNAEALIDFALSHIPKRDGKRGTRQAKRMALKWASKRKYDAITKQEIFKANLKRHEKQKRIRAEVKAVWAEVSRLKEIATMKAEVRAARDNKAAQTTA